MIRITLRLLLFWMFFFLVQRFIFLAINFNTVHSSWVQLLVANLKALPMDVASCCYIMALPVLAMCAGLFLKQDRVISRIVNIETIVMIVLCAIIGAADAGIYKVWGTKMNAKALSYMAYPKEVLPMLFSMQNVGLLLIILAQVVFFVRLYQKIQLPFSSPEWKLPYKIIAPVLFTGIVILGMRGGFQRVPLNRNWVFHSSHSVLNYASLNGFWNISDLLFRPLEKQHNPYVYFKHKDAEQMVTQMHQSDADATQYVLNTQKPNIVIVFLESWAADVVECLGGEKNVTPKFGELAKEGILFNHCYSTGYRTEQGLLATLSAHPAQPVSSIIQSFGKFDKLPNLYRVMNEQGYHTSYYTGGRLFFDNVEAYLRAAGVQKMVGEDEFEIQRRTVWGAYDEEVFALHINELNNTPEPFFSAMATMTTHEWFDADVPNVFSGDADKVNDQYRNTMHYADSCLYAYIKAAQQQPWYENTLFVIVADHSCMFPRNRNIYEQERYHIPLLMMGGALKKEYQGTVNERVTSHVDLSSTLLNQMDLADTAFHRSKNIFNKRSPEFAYYAFENGFGLITKNKTVIYDHNQHKDLANTPDDSSAKRLESFGKAYLQTHFQRGIDL